MIIIAYNNWSNNVVLQKCEYDIIFSSFGWEIEILWDVIRRVRADEFELGTEPHDWNFKYGETNLEIILPASIHIEVEEENKVVGLQDQENDNTNDESRIVVA